MPGLFEGKIEFALDGQGDPLDRDGHLRIDRVDGDIKDLRNFLVFETVFPDQLEYHLTAGRKGLDGLLYLLMNLGRDQDLFRGKRGIIKIDMNVIEGLRNAGLCLAG